jgi:hypothetical protein
MNNEKMNQMIDEAYENYLKGGDIKWLKQEEVDTPIGKMNIPIPYTKEEFIDKCKTDSKFSERWGLLIKETYDLIPHTEDFGDVIITTSKRKNKLIVVYKNEIIEVYEN